MSEQRNTILKGKLFWLFVIPIILLIIGKNIDFVYDFFKKADTKLENSITDINNNSNNIIINQNFSKIDSVPKQTRVNNSLNKNKVETEKIEEEKEIYAPPTLSQKTQVIDEYQFEKISCDGNAINQTVSITFSMANINAPNQEINIVNNAVNKSKVGDDVGREYSLMAVSIGGQSLGENYYNIQRELTTGSSLLITVTFRNILPNIKRLNYVNVAIGIIYSGQHSHIYKIIYLGPTDISWR